jgi:hypothetical protein
MTIWLKGSEAIIHQKGMHNLASKSKREDNYAKTTKMVIIMKPGLPKQVIKQRYN